MTDRRKSPIFMDDEVKSYIMVATMISRLAGRRDEI